MAPHEEIFSLEGIPVRCLYPYNERIRSLLYQFKGCGDSELKDVFLARQAPLLHWLYHGYLLAPAPSFRAKDEARGFNHVQLMFSLLKLPFIEPFIKTDDVKQADNSYAERQRIGEHIRFDETVSVRGRKILFVDDLLTTGATAKACCRLLKEHGARKVAILTMGHTPKEELGKGGAAPAGPP
jgi:ComF family protein